MAAPWLWAVAELRRRWRATLVLVLLVGLGSGPVVAAVAGARRTETAFGRFQDVSLAPDLNVQIVEEGRFGGFGPGGDEALGALRALPEVAAVGAIDLFLGANPDSSYDVGVFSGPGPLEDVLGRPRLIRGRLPDPGAAGDVLTNEETAAEAGLEVGDRFTIATFTPAQVAAIEEEFTGFGGPEIELRLVGITRTPDDLLQESTGGFYGTPAFREQHLGEVGSYGGVMLVRLREGVDERDAAARVRDVLGDIEALDEVNVEEGIDRVVRVEAATDVLGDGLLAFAAVAAIAIAVAAGQAVGRRLGALQPEQAALDAIGLTRGQRAAGAALTVVPVAVLGAMLAAVVAVFASPLFPIGVAKAAEPAPGVDLDGAVLGLGAVAVALAVLAMAATSGVRVSRLRSRTGGPVALTARARRSGAVAASARAGASASAVLGVSMALEPGRGRSAVPVRPAITGAVLGTAGIVAALTFGASLDRLIDTPAAYGFSFDLAPEVYKEDVDVVVESPDIADVGRIDLAQVEVGGRAMQGMALEVLKGDPRLQVTEGRAPSGPDEVALGTKDVAVLGLDLGDDVEIMGPDGSSRPLTLVGRLLFPVLDGNAFDSGALLDPEVLTASGMSGGFDQTVITWADGVDHAEAEARLLEALPESLPVYAYPSKPGSVANLAGVAFLPRVVAVFLILVGLVAIGHALVAGVLRRRRDLAVVRVLGFVRRQVASTVTWQSLTLAAIGLVVGIPLGVATGRVVWTAVADGIGVPPSPTVPAALVAAVIPVTIVAGVAFAALPARAAVRQRPADGLRVE